MPARGGPVAAGRAPEPPVRVLARATIGAVGDVLMHEAVKRSAETHGRGAPDAGYAWLYAPIADLLSAPDVTFANLETPIAPAAGGGTREYVFNAPPDAVAALRDAGVDVVSVANNHAFDQGRAGFEETLRRIEAGGLRVVGAGPADRPAGPVIVGASGLTLAFLGWAQFFNQDGNACPAARPGAAPCLQAAQLDRARALDAVREAAASKPFLGLCIGLQMLFERSDEGDTPGLAILPGEVLAFARAAETRQAGLKIPHMGWNEAWQARPHALWRGIPDGARFYFVHSYYCLPRDPSLTAAISRYPHAFTSAIARDNIFATQFHPEKSSAAGLTLLENFVSWTP